VSWQRGAESGVSRALEVLWVATRLGLTSFGGPVAHIGYFREEYVGRRKWVDEATYVDLVALCQFLPGPASSQVGMAIGITRAGLLGWSGGLARIHPSLRHRARGLRLRRPLTRCG
jgi:chromate transporter